MKGNRRIGPVYPPWFTVGRVHLGSFRVQSKRNKHTEFAVKTQARERARRLRQRPWLAALA